MEVLAFTVINKEIECDIKQVVGDNDYQASFMLDAEWNDKEVICRVVWNNKTSLDIALEDLSCVIPAYIMKRGEVSIGVYAEGDEQLTTEPWLLSVRKSIREKEFETAMPHKEIWNEINEKIKNVITSNDLDEKVVLSVNDVIDKSGFVKNDELSTEINAYLPEYFGVESKVKELGLATLKNALAYINVTFLGVDNAGAKDNADLLQTIIDSVPSGTTLYFPTGVYLLSKGITINKSIQLIGDRKGRYLAVKDNAKEYGSCLKFMDTVSNDTMITQGANSWSLVIRNLTHSCILA